MTSSRACVADKLRLREVLFSKEPMDDEDRSLQHAICENKEVLAILQAAPKDHVESANTTQQMALEIQRAVDGTHEAKEHC